MITNKQGVGGDAELSFCSVNELPDSLKDSEKSRVFPLSQESAKKVSLGWKAIETKLSANFYGMKLAILPTLLDKNLDLRDVIEILEDGAKGKIHDIEFAEEVVLDLFLQSTAEAEVKLHTKTYRISPKDFETGLCNKIKAKKSLDLVHRTLKRKKLCKFFLVIN